jgi:hypothetical protein
VVQIEELEPLHLGEDDALLDQPAQRGGQERAIQRRGSRLRALLLDQVDAGLGGQLRQRHRVRVDYRHHLVDQLALLRKSGAGSEGEEQQGAHGANRNDPLTVGSIAGCVR